MTIRYEVHEFETDRLASAYHRHPAIGMQLIIYY